MTELLNRLKALNIITHKADYTDVMYDSDIDKLNDIIKELEVKNNVDLADISVELPISKQNQFSKRLKQFCDENELTSMPTHIAMPMVINYLFEKYNIDIKGN